MKWTLVAYDVPDDKRRDKLARALTKLGYRVQYSVFLIPDASTEHLQRLITPLIAKDQDDVRVHPLCAACLERSLLLGLATQPDRDRTWHIY